MKPEMEAGHSTKIWTCKIGERPLEEFKNFPHGSDSPMRKAATEAYRAITGHDPDFIFSGWGGELTEGERAVVENRAPALPATSPAGPRVPGLSELLEEHEFEKFYLGAGCKCGWRTQLMHEADCWPAWASHIRSLTQSPKAPAPVFIGTPEDYCSHGLPICGDCAIVVGTTAIGTLHSEAGPQVRELIARMRKAVEWRKGIAPLVVASWAEELEAALDGTHE